MFLLCPTIQRREMQQSPPGELLEGAEGHHGSHALAGWCEGRVEQDVADTGHVHHAVVVQVGRERHSVTMTKKEKEKKEKKQRKSFFRLCGTMHTSRGSWRIGDQSVIKRQKQRIKLLTTM